VRAASLVLAPDRMFKEAAREKLTVRPGVAHASV